MNGDHIQDLLDCIAILETELVKSNPQSLPQILLDVLAKQRAVIAKLKVVRQNDLEEISRLESEISALRVENQSRQGGGQNPKS